ncbi:HK97 family phage portal protein [Clostridium beijerinckii]|uniref:phage portal protein n=1 Tax=Clostridium beijerinckii TaxID=1520 RepID=UPI00156E90C0|nr:phage portal protein [Clostridium beijerinckii]NRT32642.1 HK97 family phage portal protein [Clostridium beijerinckii]NRT47930.1 HK97 family phage portal protein [Clostridium beijerinckii]NRZ23774.1 HK97 family phage portal protein [Clostridium beijerinckii]
MGLFKNRFKQQEIKNQTYSLSDKNLLSLLGIDSNTINSNILGEVIFYTCLDFYCKSVSKLSEYKYSYDALKGQERIIDTSLDSILNLEPNPYMSAKTFKSCVELQRNFYGNAYVWNKFINGKLDSRWILDSESVTVWQDNEGLFDNTNSLWYIWYDKNNGGKKYIFSSDEVSHYKTDMTWDGIMGIAVKDVLSMQLDTLKQGESYINKLYKSGMFGDKILLQYTGDLDSSAKDELVKGVERYGNLNSSKFLPLPVSIKADLLSMKLSDAEFSVISNTNALRIAGAFGLSPNIINDYSKSSYANSVSQQMDFYVNSLSPVLQMYKQEDTRKLIPKPIRDKGIFLEYSTKELFKLDPSAHMDYLVKGSNNGLIKINEAREELGYNYVDGADILVMNGNLAPLDIIKSGANYNKNSTVGGDNVNEK